MTTFVEKERKPITLDKILKDFYKNENSPIKKAPKRKLINADKEHNNIKKKFRLKKFSKQKITKRVENFVYLSMLSKNTRKQTSPRKDEALVSRSSKRPATSRGNRMKICTDMRIVSLGSNSPNKDNVTLQSHSKGKVTYFTENKTPSQVARKS